MPSITSRTLSLRDTLDQINSGMIAIPDFQRKFVWDPESVRELLVSIIGNYYIGSLLSISSPTANSPFAITHIEGVNTVFPKIQFQKQVNIILDGQQRLTSIYYAFYQPQGMTLKNQRNPYLYFLNLDQALSGSDYIDEAVEGVSGNHKNRLQKLSSDDNYIEFKNLLDITYIVNKYKNDNKLNKIVALQQSISSFPITFLDLPFNTSLIQIVETFERINRTGKPLTIFELLSAKLYQKNIRLYNLLDNAVDDYSHIENVEPEVILRIICFIRDTDFNRSNILDLSCNDFEQDWKKACHAFKMAYKRLMDLQSGYGVYDFNKIPFNTMIIPLAAILLYLKEQKLDNAKNYKKIDKWYWVSVFNERYTQSTNAISYSDYKLLKDYLSNNATPDFISNFDLNTIQLDVDSTGSAIYKGIFCLLALNNVKDYTTDQSIKIEPEKVQDDHIFPKSKYKDNSVLNRTLISTNQKKSSKHPSIYFNSLLAENDKNIILRRLATHFISNKGLDALLNNDLNSLKQDRKANIIKFIDERIK